MMITWGIGGSLLLNFYKLIEKSNDIDNLVDEKNAKQLIHTMTNLGNSKETIRIKPFKTEYFSKHSIGKVYI
ncbi:hypothetical protein [Bacillus oleivorans]|uniref:hypothetical protein n=1 Tax=Bacillus oleivorans TaxID=1448271 RepID=UPI0015C9DA24|nr:hypothetical protein [Bacillus oleivorans]